MDLQENILHELKTIRKLLVLQSRTVFYCEHCKKLKAFGHLEDGEKTLCPTCKHEVEI